MPLAEWFRPPRRTMTVFLGLMAVLGTAMGWLAWQVLDGDRAVERSRAQDHLEATADHVTSSLQQSLADLDRRLAADKGPPSPAVPGGVVFLHGTRDAFVATPSGRLLFHPLLPQPQEPPAPTFQAGEALEFRDNDQEAAARAFETLARSPNVAMRAGALVRLARVLRKGGRSDAALDAYAELEALSGTSALGLPAELAARVGRATVLQALGRREQLLNEAVHMADVLWSGRYLLLRPSWEFHLDAASRWGAEHQPSAAERQALALSAAAQWVYHQWSGPAGGRSAAAEAAHSARARSAFALRASSGSASACIGRRRG